MTEMLRYDKKDYFWINDMQPVMIMHPYFKKLIGKDVSRYKDPEGTFLFLEFIETVENKGSGFVHYMWPKPGMDAPVPKVSYVKGFKPWGWILGSGIYLDDIEASFWKQAGTFALIFAGLTFIIIVINYFISRSIVSPINKFKKMLQKIANGDMDIPLNDDDENDDENIATMINAIKNIKNQAEVRK